MFAYLVRRIVYAIPILIGVNLITFVLFFMVNSPDDMARMQLGQKHVTPEAIHQWKMERGYDKPLFYNAQKTGAHALTDTLFFTKSLSLFTFDFGQSDRGRDISDDIGERLWPSLALAFPTLLIGLAINITFALLITLFRATTFDYFAMTVCVIMMSVSGLFYIIFGQYLFGKLLNLTPISGYQYGLAAIKFLILPVLIGAVGGIGAGTRWYRTIFLEEIHREYVRTARAKGLSELSVLFKHVLKNALIPILTGVVVIIPTLFMGSLIMESFFGIPGLGSYTIDAIAQQDFNIVRAMVFLGTIFYVLGLILTDISYTLVDPRVRLQ
ncbi:MAG: peptide ABC transporter permease [Gammaproteobacteria bacterium RIFCSPLOWO2_02_FULL_42_14]|nr:MAG: peptide ABC transporter permease [Gammaproteobacteria bacterium RIFCSPHIGHO2_02_FULL_42_43]OGT27624.1 MAG: peptide ABC transporter permease [Gammaproteobacteria bacterium RIFCSPHIGHO2_01_FULL_42_8]OGT53140.1 MAG: peptide ABC transporter permease [Gammaproteobacteria bacterium RIFCSPHIGHO2_12_FULL_41_25]OGT60969.1 MAG: peptide ABC transporter permease [Gammaproteobacteria bacterium RIFCSPLOWO2_02_FULL_42_14]OGT85285.1 MAG: peptide ABC transporter permease [Gammaproteobacteria bacterium R